MDEKELKNVEQDNTANVKGTKEVKKSSKSKKIIASATCIIVVAGAITAVLFNKDKIFKSEDKNDLNTVNSNVVENREDDINESNLNNNNTETENEEINQTTSENENTSSNSNNSTYDKEAYVQKIKEIKNEYSDVNLKYGLVYIDEDDVPELIVDCEWYWQSIYKLKNGKVVSIAENAAYGTHGSSGYSYIPRKNIFIRYATDYAGYGYEIYDENMEMQYSVYCSFDGHYEKNDGIEITQEDFEELSYKNQNTIYLKDEAKMDENEIIAMLTNDIETSSNDVY